MLNITNLTVIVEEKEIVQKVSLKIKPGEIHILMGPNGAGKSSLALALMGHPSYQCQRTTHHAPSTISLDGTEISRLSPDQRARLGLFLAPQNPPGTEGVSVQHLLREGSDPSQDMIGFRKKLEQLAKKLSIKTSLLRRSLNVNFSGGEKKKMEILQMLTLRPKYIILDEIDSGLDVDSLKQIIPMIKTAQWSNGYQPGILLIGHNPDVVQYLKPDFVHIIKDGKIAASGSEKLADNIKKEGYAGFK